MVRNIYDAIGGKYLGKATGPPVEIDLGSISVRPQLRDTQLAGPLRKAVERYVSVSQETAKERHADHLNELGIPTPCRSIDVGRSQLVHMPMYLAMLRREGADRVVAVNARSGDLNQRVSSVLTANIGHLRQAFGKV